MLAPLRVMSIRRRHSQVMRVGLRPTPPRANGQGNDPSFPLRDAPPNPPERTAEIERIVERVAEEHSETLEKLADE
jgi:hypothetical protein